MHWGVAFYDIITCRAYFYETTGNLYHNSISALQILSIKSPSLAHVQSSLPCNVIKNRYANINCCE